MLQDRELGQALRAALQAGPDGAFIARVRAEMTTSPAWWEVLNIWARPGLAAAITLIALAGLWLGAVASSGNGMFDETIAAAAPGSGGALLAADRPPTVDVMLAVARPQN